MCHSKLSPLLWNEFPITHYVSDVLCVFEVQICTRRLSLNQLTDDTVDRHRLIEELHSKGHSDKEIAKVLNAKNIKTPRGLKYYQELVFVTRRKIRLRQERSKDLEVKIGKIDFYLINQV